MKKLIILIPLILAGCDKSYVDRAGVELGAKIASPVSTTVLQNQTNIMVGLSQLMKNQEAIFSQLSKLSQASVVVIGTNKFNLSFVPAHTERYTNSVGGVDNIKLPSMISLQPVK